MHFFVQIPIVLFALSTAALAICPGGDLTVTPASLIPSPCLTVSGYCPLAGAQGQLVVCPGSPATEVQLSGSVTVAGHIFSGAITVEYASQLCVTVTGSEDGVGGTVPLCV